MTKFVWRLLLYLGLLSGAIQLSAQPTTAIPAAERQALLDLYRATGGDAWLNHTGWGGPPGSECLWAGVACGPLSDDGVQRVILIDLSKNNLRGTVPESLANLTDLMELLLSGNQIATPLPESLIRHRGPRDIDLGIPVEPITEIRLNSFANFLCGDREVVVMDVSGAVSDFRERCRRPKAKDPKPYCELSRGRTSEFSRLARFLRTNGFFDTHVPENACVDCGTLTAEVRGPNGVRTVDVYSSSDGPLRKRPYEKAIREVLDGAKWSRPVIVPKCSWP